MKYRENKVQMFMKLFVMLFSKLHHKIEENLLILFYKEEKPKSKAYIIQIRKNAVNIYLIFYKIF